LEKTTTEDIETEETANKDRSDERETAAGEYENEKATFQDTISSETDNVTDASNTLANETDNHESATNLRKDNESWLQDNKADHTWWKKNHADRKSQQDAEIAGYEEVIGVVQGTAAYKTETDNMGAAAAQREADYQSGKSATRF
jgi:hypothetical protein